MEDIEEHDKPQGSLFGGRGPAPLYFLTTQRNLLSFLGSGMIVPSGSQFRYKVDTRDEYSGAIPFWKGGLPNTDAYSSLIGDDRAAIIECDIDDVMKYGGRNLLADDENLIVVNAPIPLRCVAAIYMHSTASIDDFLIRLTDDIIAERAVFKPMLEMARFPIFEQHNIKVPDDIQSELTFIDAFGGGLKALEYFSVPEISDYSHVLNILPACIVSNEPETSERGADVEGNHKSQISSSDHSILMKILPALKNIKVEDGFDPIMLLGDLEESLLNEKGAELEDVYKWLSYVRKVLESEIEVPVLSDEGGIFKRAILLYFLRPSLDRLSEAAKSSISPGPKVLSIAAFLAGYANGLTRMGSEYKGDYRAFTEFTKSLLNSLWCKSKYALNFVREPLGNFGACFVYEINNERLIRFRVEQDITLARVLNQAKSAGYDLSYDFDKDEIYYKFHLEDNRSQTVYIEKLEPLADGFDVIRFVSPCLDLSTGIAKKLNKTTAIDFLKRNTDESMYCSFAFSERRKAIVVEATQIVKTMDDDEFVTLLKYVALKADAYEREVLGKDNY